jgi:hypothetical protein
MMPEAVRHGCVGASSICCLGVAAAVIVVFVLAAMSGTGCDCRNGPFQARRATFKSLFSRHDLPIGWAPPMRSAGLWSPGKKGWVRPRAVRGRIAHG